MAHKTNLKNPKYRTWVKTGLGLKYLKEGLEQFTVDVMDDQHQAILMTVRKASKLMHSHCNQCQVNTLMPNHVRTKTNHCPLGVNDCNCRQPRGKQTCPNDICGAIYEQIIQLHGSTPPAPYWRNTNATLWCSDPWEIAKCFINAPGYANTTSAHGTDCAGLLQIIVNNLGFHSHLKCDITGLDIFSKTRQYRNEILHSASMELEDQTSIDYIDGMISVLQDPKELSSRPESVSAVQKLKELKNKDFVITIDNDMEIIQEMRNTLAKEADESVEKIKSYALDKMTEMERKKVDIDNEVRQSKTDAIDEMLVFRDNIQNKHTNDLETKANELKKEIESTVKAQENRITKSITAATYDFNLSKIAAVKEMENLQNDLLSKHLIELDKKVEEINLQLSAKEGTVPKSVIEEDANRKHEANSVAEYQMGETKNKQETPCLTNSAALFQKPSDYDTDKQEFKKRLICLYMKSIVKESILPLHPEMNETTIGELYVTPWMKLEVINCKTLKTKSSDKLGTRQEQHINIQSFSDIFFKDGKQLKQIYILGEAGSGKSAFCKNIVYKWCLSHSETNVVNALSQRGNMSSTEEILSDEEVMKRYEFLFYISLRYNTDAGDIKTMLKNHYEDPLLDAVLERESEKCLILADGLDEWKPPTDTKMSQTQTNGLPKRDLYKNYAVITTSRPWKFEGLKIRDSEIDSKIRICGIEYKSVIKMATYIISHLNTYFEKKKSVNRFLAKYVLSNDQTKTPLNDIVTSPVMLKQLVCLWFEDKLCQSLRCQIYCSMLELSLEWSVQRKRDNTIFETFRELSLNSEKVSLPQAFDDSICDEYKLIVIRAGKLAYQTLFSEQKESSLTFSHATLRRYGATKDFIQCCLEMGILTEEQDVTFSLTKRRNTQFSFSHKSIQEILAAIFIVMECQTFENINENETMNNIVECFKNVKSLEDVLEQSYVIEIICGLDPALASCVSRYIYDIVVRDERFIEYRKTLVNWYDFSMLSQIQELIFQCIKEFQHNESRKAENLYLADIILRHKSDIPLLRYIKTCSIMSVTIAGEIWGLSRSSIHLNQNDVEILCNIVGNCNQSIRRFSKLDSITADADEELPIYYVLVASTYSQLEVLELKCIKLSHDSLSRLSSLIEKNTKLKEVSLKEIRCDDESCQTHNIGLPDHAVLQYIDINSTDCKLQDLNAQNLTICSLTEMNRSVNVCHFLKNAQVLEYLYLSSCTFVLDGQKLVTMLKLKYVDLCDLQISETTWHLLISSLKTCPQLESLSLTALRLPDKVKLTLLHDIQEVNQIKRLYLRNMNIHLKFTSDLNNLKHLVFDNMECYQTSTCNFIESLQYVYNLEHIAFKNMDIENSCLLPPCKFVSLKHILLQNIKLGNESWMEFGKNLQKLHHLESLQFQRLNIPENALKFTCSMKHLKSITFQKVTFSLDCWKEIADSLSMLPQSIEVQTVDLYIENGSNETAIDYVKKRNDLFQVTLSYGVDCSYKTVKGKSS